MFCPLIFVIFASSCSFGHPLGLASQARADQYRAMGLKDREHLQYADAIAAFKKATVLDPTNPAGHILLGWTQHLNGQDAQATQTLTLNTLRNPFSVQTWNALGIVLLVQGELKAATQALSWASVLEKDNEIAYYNLSLAYQRSQHYDWAITMAQRAADLEPENPHPFVALAVAQWSKGERGSAIASYRQVLQVDGRYRDPDFLGYLSEAGFHPTQIEIARQVLAKIR